MGLYILPFLLCLTVPVTYVNGALSWNRFVPIQTPTSRAYSISAVNTTNIILSGGRSGDNLDTTPGDLSIDTATGNIKQLPAAEASLRVSQSAYCDIPDSANSNVLPVRAYSLMGLNEDGSEVDPKFIYAYTPGIGWEKKAANGTTFPVARRGAQCIYLRECRVGRNCLIVYGGIGTKTVNTASDACWIFFPATGTYQICTQSGTLPPVAGGIIGHNLGASPDGLSIYLYGGLYLGTGQVSSDIYQLKVNGYYDADATQAEMTSLATGSTSIVTAGSSSLFNKNMYTATAAETKVAFDGSTTTTYTASTGAGCFVTYSNATNPGTRNPWIRVDIGYPSYVPYSDNNIWLLRAFMRTDASTNLNQGVTFWVSNVTSPLPWEGGGVQFPNPYTDMIYTPTILWAPGYPNAIRPVNGRYVWAANLGNSKVLQICELQVYQPSYWRWRKLSGVVNLALNKRAYQVSMDPGFAYGDPQNMVDGATGTVMRTPSAVKNVWAYVDLGETYDVSYITVIDGASSNYWRNNNTEIVLGDSTDAFSPTNRQCYMGVMSCFMWGDPVYGYLANPLCTSSTATSPITFNMCYGTARYVFLRKHEANTNIDLSILPPARQCQFYPTGTGCPAWCVALGSSCGGAGIWDSQMLVIAELQVYGNKLRYEPTGRYGAASALYGPYMVIVGGQDNNGFLLSDTRLFNMVTGRWEAESKPLGTPPSGRTYASLVLYSSGISNNWLVDGLLPPANKIAFFGGIGISSTYNDIATLSFPACPALTASGSIGVSSISCYRSGTVCTYTCSAGFVTNGGQADASPATPYYSPLRGYIHCKADGTWSAYFPLCVSDGSAGMLPNPPTFVANPPTVVTSSAVSSSLSFLWQRPAISGYGNLNGPTTYRIRSVPQFWTQRFTGQQLDSAWILRNGPPFSSLTGSYTIDKDGLLALDAHPNGECKFAQQDCVMLTRNFPTGPNLPNVASDPWTLETKVSFNFFTSRAPQQDNMIGFGIFDTSTPITVPDPRNASKTITFNGALHFMVDMKRWCSPCEDQAGWEALNAASGFSYVYATTPSLVPGISGSPWAYLRIDRWPDESVLSSFTGVIRPGFGAWRMCQRFDTGLPWACGQWYNDNTFLRANATGTRVFNPATSQIALFARSRTTTRAYGMVHYVRFGHIYCDPPGPVIEVPATTMGSPSATQNLTTDLIYAAGSRLRFSMESGGVIGYGPSSVTPSNLVSVPITTNAWNSSDLIEVAKGKRSGQSSICPTTGRFATGCPVGTTGLVNYGPSFGNDGTIDVSVNTGGFVFTGREFDGAWWFVDLGIPTAVKEIALYNRVDANWLATDNFKIILTQLENRNSGTECDPAQIPDSIIASSVYNGKTFAARFNCSYPTGLIGRYVFVSNAAGASLNFREIQVFASNSCKTNRTATNAAQIPGTNCLAGAPWGTVCVHECLPGYVPVSGSSASTCNGDGWNDPPLVCAPSCPLLPAPEHAASCRQTMYRENFNNPTSVSSAWVSLMEAYPTLGQYIFAVNDGLQISAGLGCTNGIIAVTMSSKINNWHNAFSIQAKVNTNDRAGLVWRALDVNNFYRVHLDTVSQIHTVERMYNGFLTVLTTSSAVTVAPDSWVTVRVDVTVDGLFTITVGGALLVEVTDISITSGTVGVSSQSLGSFDDFFFEVSCDSCDGATNQDTCTFICAAGLKPIGVTDVANPDSGTRQCVTDVSLTTARWVPNVATNGGVDMYCTLDPPYFPAVTLRIAENSPRNALVDNPLIATITSPEYQVLFSISGGNINNTFYIDSCSGQIKVRTPIIDYETRSSYLLNVTASVDGFPGAITTTTITIQVINVDEAPAVIPTTFVLAENPFENALVGKVPALDPENDTITYTIEVDGAAGRFIVLPNGEIRVANNLRANAIDFEASGTWPYSFIVRATETTALGVYTSTGLYTTGKMTITLVDRNDPPVVDSINALVVQELPINNGGGGSAGVSLVATDQDNIANGNYSSPLRFALVNAATANTITACSSAITTKPPYSYPTVDGTPGTADLFAVNPTTGALSVTNSPNPLVSNKVAFPVFKFNNDKTRIVYVLCVNVSDNFGGYSINPAYVAVHADDAGEPSVQGILSPDTGFFSTSGGTLVLYGVNFGPSNRPSNVYGISGNRRVNLTNCVPNNDTLSCTVPPGCGASYKIFVEQALSGGSVFSSVTIEPESLTFSYYAPVVTSISLYPTNGSVTALPVAYPSTLVLKGYNFSVCSTSGTLPDVFFTTVAANTAGSLTMNIQSLSHNIMYISVEGYHSANWEWTLHVGDQTVVSTSGQFISFEIPTLTSIAAVNGSCPNSPCTVMPPSTLNNLDTSGGQLIQINGTGFYKDASFVLATYTSGSSQVNTFSSCNIVSYSTMYCLTTIGVGYNLQVAVKIGNSLAISPGFMISYAPPVIFTATTDSPIPTEGGTLITITGKYFGPPSKANIDYFSYGPKFATDVYKIESATSLVNIACDIISDGRITCTSLPGVGKNHWAKVSIGGQVSVDTGVNLAYMPPSVYSFDGVGSDNADTIGNQEVLITGRNFGPSGAYTNSLLRVTYGVAIRNGPKNLTSVKFLAANCTIDSNGHTLLHCQTAEGAGRSLGWTVTVAGQDSVQPTTSYAAPIISSISLYDGATPAAVADVFGGTTAIIQGYNFGPIDYNNTGPLLQAVTYGPNGDEYSIPLSKCILISHNEIRVTLLPGSGKNMRMRVAIADQTSALSTATFDFATPIIVSVNPNTASTFSDSRSPTVVTLAVKNLPLTDPRSRINMNFGNLPVTPILPVGAAAIAAQTNLDKSININFFLPSGSGIGIPIQFIITSTVSGAEVDRSAVTYSSLFSYRDPEISSVVVTRARFADPLANETNGNLDAIKCPFPGGSSAWDCNDASLVQLTILGNNFAYCSANNGVCDGPSTTWEAVSKTLDVLAHNYTADGGISSFFGELWCGMTCAQWRETATLPVLNNVPLLWVQAWDHNKIIAYVKSTTATLRLRMVSTNAVGSKQEQYLIYTFAQASPEIGELNGNTVDIPTTGATSYMVLKIYNLGQDNTIEVTVAGRPATLVLNNCELIPSKPTIKDFINYQLSTITPGSPVTICAIVPPGQGRYATVQVTRIDSNSLREGSNTGFYVSYLPPSVSSVEIWPAGASAYSTSVVPSYGASLSAATDGSTKFCIRGTNLGVAPTIYMGDTYYAGEGVNATECPGTAGMHTCYEVYSVPGEGACSDCPEYANSGGYQFYLSAGDQPSAKYRFAYDPAIVTSVVPATAGANMPTEGGVPVIIMGKNFGTTVGVHPTSPIIVEFFYPGGGSRLQCTSVVRISHTQIQCTLPEGSGKDLSVAIKVADINGTTTNLFSYDLPTLTQATIVPQSVLLSYAGLNNSWGIKSYFNDPNFPGFYTIGNLTGATGGIPGSTLGLLQGSSSGGDILLLQGNNFGVLDANAHCAFLTWTFRSTDTTGRIHNCDNRENFLGEGEISSNQVLIWNHHQIALLVPEGIGTKDIEVSIRGAMFNHTIPRTNPATARFRYLPPAISNVRIGWTGCGGGGGGVGGNQCTPPMAGTEGGENVNLYGSNFGPSPRNFSNPALRLPGETGWSGNGLSISEAAGLPTAVIAVSFHRSCVTLGTSVTGLRLTTPFRTWYSGTGTVNLDACESRSMSVSHNRITFPSPPGIGKSRSIQVFVVEDASGFPTALTHLGSNVFASSPAGTSQLDGNITTFSYRAPTVTSYYPPVLYLRSSSSADENSNPFDIYGSDFGNEELADTQGWTADERAIDAKVGGIDCTKVTRRRQNGVTVLNCGLPGTFIKAGYRNVSVTIAGQTGYGREYMYTYTSGFGGSTMTFVPLLLVCAPGFYGHVNETCLPCPAQYLTGAGAKCTGYDDRVAKFEDKFTYPRPLSGWYNLNSSDANTAKWGTDSPVGQLSACPENFQDNGRDVCIVPCDPPESCLGDNYCAPGYASKPPMYRCSNCDRGFFRRAGQCIKCPDSPAGLFIGALILLIAVAGLGFLLNKKQVNIAVVSIGVDFFQVLAIFSQSRIAWPPVVKELFHVLSAFNLNIEIVAPECLIPDVSYKQKFWFIMLLPLGVGFLLFLAFLIPVFNKVFIKNTAKKLWFDHRYALISSCLVLLYMLYLYLTRTIFDVFSCTPTVPPDGYTYLSVANNERCGVPGGTQMTLMGYAVAGLLVYTIGYPVFIGYTIWSNHELAMEDQLLRAKGVGNDKLTNPHAYLFRLQFGRSYFQFRPDYIMWILAIILRKCLIAITAVVFNKNASFQMAACLLIMFVAYAAQTTFRPYMSPSDYDQVLREHMDASHTSAVHARLRAAIANIETRGRKKVRRNLLNFDGKVDRNAILGVLSGWLFNYNTVEQVMLFAAVIVCLMGIMYQANEVNTYYPQSKDSVTAVVLAVIIIAILYFVTVLFTEMFVLMNESNRAQQLAKAASRNKGKQVESDSEKRNSISRGKLVGEDGEINTGKLDNQMNPLFMNSNGNVSAASAFGGNNGNLADTILAQREAPSTDMWRAFQNLFVDMQQQLEASQAALIEAKRNAQRGGPSSPVATAEDESENMTTNAIRRKAQFAPRASTDGPSGDARAKAMASFSKIRSNKSNV